MDYEKEYLRAMGKIYSWILHEVLDVEEGQHNLNKSETIKSSNNIFLFKLHINQRRRREEKNMKIQNDQEKK